MSIGLSVLVLSLAGRMPNTDDNDLARVHIDLVVHEIAVPMGHKPAHTRRRLLASQLWERREMIDALEARTRFAAAGLRSRI